MSPGAGESRLRRHGAWLVVAAAYLVTFPYFERLNNPNENVRVWTTRAIVMHGTFAIDAVERDWGEVKDRAAKDGRRFSSKAPGTSLLGVPVLWAHTKLAALAGAHAPSKQATTWVLRVFTVALPLAIFLLVFARRVEAETGSPWARDLLVGGLGIGTLMYPYGLLFVGHAQSAALLFGGYLLGKGPSQGPFDPPRSGSGEPSSPEPTRPGKRPSQGPFDPPRSGIVGPGPPATRLVVAGVLVGLSVVFEYQTLLAAAAVMVFVIVVRRGRAAFFLLGALGPALLLAAYHTALFSRPWASPLSYVDDPIFREFHRVGFLGFSRPRLGVLAHAFVSRDYGLFVFSPLLAAGFVAALFALRAGPRREGALVLAVTGAMALFLSGMSNWRGGWCAGGPRYIAAVAPFLAWAIALTWNRLWAARPAPAVVLGGLAAVSVVLCGVAGAHFPHYPLQFDNPVFDVSTRLLGEGYAPRGLGSLLGLSGAAAFAPVGALVAAALVLALGARLRPVRQVAASAALAALLLAALALSGRRVRPDEERALTLIRDVWEPRRGDGPL